MADKQQASIEALAETADKIYGSLEEMVASGANDTEYKLIDGFKPGEKVRIGSVSAGDFAKWSEASEGEAKKTMGFRLITKSLVGPPPGNIRYADDPKNIPKLREMRVKETERIVREIIKLNEIGVKEETVKKD